MSIALRFIFVQNQTDVCQCNHKFKQVYCLLPWFRKNQDVVRKPQESSQGSPRFSKSIPSVLTTCSTYREPIQHLVSLHGECRIHGSLPCLRAPAHADCYRGTVGSISRVLKRRVFPMLSTTLARVNLVKCL